MSERLRGKGGQPDGFRGSLESRFEPRGESVAGTGSEDVEVNGDVKNVQIGLGCRQKVYRELLRPRHANANVESVL